MMPRIGGNTSWAEFREHYAAKLAEAPVAAEGWPHQCRCGEMVIVRYRGRFYCRNCGNRWRYCPYKVMGRGCDCALPAPGRA